jgi:poly(3-hydroxybutyrate) depolymerase
MLFYLVSLAKSQRRKGFLLLCSKAFYVLCFPQIYKIAGFSSYFASLRLYALIVTSAFTFQSCSTGSDSKKDTKQQSTDSITLKEHFLKGQIIDQVICKNDASQSYTLYLPANYSTEKSYPVIYAFDPHAEGKLPVSLYKELADQYGYILVGSNNSKNGTTWEESQNIANKLFADAGNRLSINTERIYVLGFSGGARVANALAITNGSISSVICCGASAPMAKTDAPRNNYSFLGIVGNEDFNYVEMRKYDMVELAGQNIKHLLITFDGKHEWPAVGIMDDAFWWLALNDVRKNNATKNDTLIAKRYQVALKQIESYQEKKQIFETYKLCQKTINFYDGLADLSSCYSIYKALQSNPEVDKQLKLEEGIWTEEEELKQQYLKALQTQNISWWNKNMATLNQKIKTGADKNKVLMNKRLLNFLSLAAYMQTAGALKQNNLPAAEFFGKIYLLVDPTNNEAHYLMGAVFAKTGNSAGAIRSLNLAIENGFTDITRLQSDEAFSRIKNTKEFEDAVKEIR